jgi:hypothetical protein
MNVFLFRDLAAETVAALRREFPRVEFRQSAQRDDLVAALPWADAVFGNPPAALIAAAPRLRWLQIVSSGFDEYAALHGTPIVVTTAHGIHAPIIAQHVLGMMLWFARGQPHLMEQQRARAWDRRPAIPQDLARQTIGLLGYGQIGRALAAMLRALDQNVAAIVAELDRLGLSDNTILVLTSDNGAMEAGSSLPLRGAKHSIYDGGVRLPTVIHWPKGGLAGGGQWPGLCGALDMFPTLIAMTESPMPATRPLDGKNIWPALRARSASPVESYYWAWHGQDAIRTARWKLHRFFDHVELYDLDRDESETTNLAAGEPAVVQSLLGQMSAWNASLGTALAHQPAVAPPGAGPAPAGEVLEVTVTVTGAAKPTDKLIVPIASWDGSQQATDHVEFDLAVAPGSPAGGFFYSPFKGNDTKSMQLFFKRGDGVDQFGREQVTGPAIKGGPGHWEHRVIGLSSWAPGSIPRHALVFTGGKPGAYTVYLDNLRIRHRDGSLSPVWKGGSDSRARAMADTAAFKDIRVRTVPLRDVRATP